MIKKTSRNRIEEFIYSNPDCPSCRRYDNVRVIFLITTLLIGIYYIYEVRDDMESQCCIQLINITRTMQSQFKNDWRYYETIEEGNNLSYHGGIDFK